MDLPKQLVKHLYTVSLARRSGKPFMIEGIGAGPFIRVSSTWVARRLVLMADNIVVRTTADKSAAIMRRLHTTTMQDPAFDYLATRGKKVKLLPANDAAWIESLLANTEGRMRIGLNMHQSGTFIPLKRPLAIGPDTRGLWKRGLRSDW